MKTTPAFLLACATAASLLAGCTTQEAYVQSEFVQKNQPANFQTYGWLKEARGDAIPNNNQPIFESVQAAIEKELNDRGFRKSASPDFKLGMLLVDRDPGQTYTLDRYFGDSLRGTDVASLPTMPNDPVEQATVVVDALDARSGDVVWRGAAMTDVNRNNSPKVRTKKINWIASELISVYKDGYGALDVSDVSYDAFSDVYGAL